jgi:hypothetical protein
MRSDSPDPEWYELPTPVVDDEVEVLANLPADQLVESSGIGHWSRWTAYDDE